MLNHDLCAQPGSGSSSTTQETANCDTGRQEDDIEEYAGRSDGRRKKRKKAESDLSKKCGDLDVNRHNQFRWVQIMGYENQPRAGLFKPVSRCRTPKIESRIASSSFLIWHPTFHIL